MRKNFKISLVLMAGMLLLDAVFPVWAASYYPGFPELRQSMAYRRFLSRPVNDFSRILYLIERFSDSEMLIIYDGHSYSCRFAGPVAKLFLSRNYKKQKPEEWIMRWCNTSIFSGKLVFVRFPDGTLKPAREILLNELKNLDQAVKDDKKIDQKSAKSGEIRASGPASAETPAP